MIIQIKGSVKFPITLDPTVWIFDERKILLDDLFNDQQQKRYSEKESKILQTTEERTRPYVNRNLTRAERDEILVNTYAMPLTDFLNHADIKEDAQSAKINTTLGPKEISLEKLYDSHLLFAINGKPLKEDGPVHLYFKDGSNKDKPIKGVKEIIIK